jgi:hypothetical protein
MIESGERSAERGFGVESMGREGNRWVWVFTCGVSLACSGGERKES